VPGVMALAAYVEASDPKFGKLGVELLSAADLDSDHNYSSLYTAHDRSLGPRLSIKWTAHMPPMKQKSDFSA